MSLIISKLIEVYPPDSLETSPSLSIVDSYCINVDFRQLTPKANDR